MVNKTPVIMEFVKDRDPGIIFISETWLKSDTSDITALGVRIGRRNLEVE